MFQSRPAEAGSSGSPAPQHWWGGTHHLTIAYKTRCTNFKNSEMIKNNCICLFTKKILSQVKDANFRYYHLYPKYSLSLETNVFFGSCNCCGEAKPSKLKGRFLNKMLCPKSESKQIAKCILEIITESLALEKTRMTVSLIHHFTDEETELWRSKHMSRHRTRKLESWF